MTKLRVEYENKKLFYRYRYSGNTLKELQKRLYLWYIKKQLELKQRYYRVKWI